MSNGTTTGAACTHVHAECPNHNGAFDCHSFCSTCEGNQEYCPQGCEMTLDENGYIVYVQEKTDQ